MHFSFESAQEEVFKTCEELGEFKIREILAANLWNNMHKRAHAKEWLHQLELSRSAEVLARQESLELENIKVAREANDIASKALERADDACDSAKEANLIARSTLEESRVSNRDNNTTARSAKNAATIAAIGAIISAICAIISVLKN